MSFSGRIKLSATEPGHCFFQIVGDLGNDYSRSDRTDADADADVEREKEFPRLMRQPNDHLVLLYLRFT